MESTYQPLAEVTRTHLDTREAAFHLNRTEKTLRSWASAGNGPLAPRRVHGRLAWSVEDLRRVIEGAETPLDSAVLAERARCASVCEGVVETVLQAAQRRIGRPVDEDEAKTLRLLANSIAAQIRRGSAVPVVA
jgi:flagellar biosynthesis/type III secretory pathway protein FliH